MQDNFKINEELKKILISDEKTKEYFLIHLLHNVYKSETPQDYKHFSLNDYEAFKGLIFNHDKPKNLYNSLSDVFNEVLNNDLINDTIKNYTDLVTTEGKNLINSVSRLLYLQDKYKDDEIGQKIDKKIKEWLEYIRSYDKNKDLKNTDKSEEAIKNTNERLYARLFYHIIMNCNYAIHCNANNEREFMDLWDYNVVKMSDLHEFIKNYLDNELNDAETNNNFSVIINNFINNLNEDINTSNFNRDKAEQIKTISDKHKIKLDNELEHTITQEQQDAFIEELTKAYIDYLKDNEVNIQDDEDIKNWHDKANNFINHLINYKGIALNGIFTMDYTLNHLAFNDYQKEAYKLNLDEEQEVKVVKEQVKESKTPTKKRLSAKELKEKYKNITLLNGEQLDYNRKWARVDTSKINTNIMDLRESITKKTQNNTDLTRKKIKEIEKKPKPTKKDLDDLKELNILLKEQQEAQKGIIEETNDLKADIDLINKQIAETTEAKQIKSLMRKRKKMQKDLSEKEAILRNEGIYLQPELLSNKLVVAEKKNKRTKESYKLMINNDYDIQNFNSEGRNFLYYIPNIPNITDALSEDFITLDIDDYLDFTGRPTGNVSRIRKNLQNTLKEMRKESYDYTYLDEKGVLHDDSLVLIGDIKGTEYKGKASVKVQLGATFKENLKQAFTKNQYVKVNSDVFKIGQGRNNKAENMAREIFLYLAKLCRIEAKNQINGGKWRKDIHLDTIITKLCELNLITYNPYRYNESVKEPLLYALNTGVELGYFTYETDAFNYYDNVIASNNRGANVQDKITNFEKGDKYGVKFIINGDMVDLEINTKAHATYNKYKNKHKATNK